MEMGKIQTEGKGEVQEFVELSSNPQFFQSNSLLMTRDSVFAISPLDYRDHLVELSCRVRDRNISSQKCRTRSESWELSLRSISLSPYTVGTWLCLSSYVFIAFTLGPSD